MSTIFLSLFAAMGFSQISVDTTVQTSKRILDTPAFWHSCSEEIDSLKLQCSEEALLDYLIEQTSQIGKHDSLVSGSLQIEFIVDSTGQTTEIKVLKSLNYFCDEKAIEIVRNMPSWIPGTEDGKPVKIRYKIPVYFRGKS